jgi:hypothetical protein
MVSPQEIKKRLDEFNLTIHPQLRQNKIKWFSQQRIKTVIYYQKLYLQTDISLQDIHIHMQALQQFHQELKNIFQECKQENVKLEMKNAEYTSQSDTTFSMVAGMDANIFLEAIKKEKAWFQEKKLAVHLGKFSYEYVGPMEIKKYE